MLEGDNAYACEQCEKKVDTLKRVCLKRLPNHLILVQKRFEFDYENYSKKKLNDYCEFPTELDLEPYTQQGIRKQEIEKLKDELNKDDQRLKFKLKPKEYFVYRLKGIIIHMGEADSGHYYSLIQCRSSDLWCEFNDNVVTTLDETEIPSEAFGGE